MRTLPQSFSERDQSLCSVPQGQLPQEARGAQPTYAGAFRCIGPQCEDTCCGGWDIPLDKLTYLRYRQFPAEALGSLVSHFVSPCDGDPRDHWYGSIHQKADGSCPFFGEDRLCGIQSQYGAELLSATCSLYPRSLAVYNGVLEGSLSLSCPEAARQVLLEEHATEQVSDLSSGDFRTDNVFGVRESNGLSSMFLQVRGFVIEVIRDRSRPMWQRLLLIVALCNRLDDVGDHDVPAASRLLVGYRTLLERGSLPELDSLSSCVAYRLELAIALSSQRCGEKDSSRRFQDVFWDMIEAIGSATSVGADEDVQRFQYASQNILEPLMNEAPFILENYLINYVYQHLFPFGRAGSNRLVSHSMSEEAVLLVVRYSWMTTLLAGVAGRHGSSFGKAHIVSTIQAFTREVEHTPSIFEHALAWVRSRELNTLPGLATLLRS